MSKRSKRTTRNSKKSAPKQSAQLCMKVIDCGATISSCNAANHFGYSPFELTIKVEPNINKLEPQPLALQLVFEDGQQIDIENKKNNIKFNTKPKSLLINKSGTCKFNVKIDTYSMFHDNRAFKLVFNLKDNATRHIIPCETKPFRLVKHRLEIITEPDDTFYKDEGGRANCLRCKILLKDCNRTTVKNRDIPLIAKLVYEDMSIAQSSRDILEILTQNVELKKGQCCIDFRINEVSKNHNKRAFRVLYECKSTDALYHDISSCVTNKIMVKSKRTKKKQNHNNKSNSNKKRKRKREIKKKHHHYLSSSSSENEDEDPHLDYMDSSLDIDEPLSKKQRFTHPFNNPYSHNFNPHLAATLNNNNNNDTQYVPPALTGILPSIQAGVLPRIAHDPPPFATLSKKNNPCMKHEGDHGGGGGVLGHMFEWCKLAGWVMNRLEWTHCGYEYDEATHSIDTRRPLYRCSYCLKYRNEAGWGKHENWCQLKLALKEYETKVKGFSNEWSYQINSKEHGQMNTLDHTSGSPPPNNMINNINNWPFAAYIPQNNMNNQVPPVPQIHPHPHPQIHAHPHPHPQPLMGFIGNNNDNINHNVKNELNNHTQDVIGNNINLPLNMDKISSVSRVRSQHGYDAYDKDKKYVGTFDDDGAFFEADQLDGPYQPIFNQTQMLLRNQSDDYLFYNNIRNSIFDSK